MSNEDPRSKRGGHRLFDHSFFPDAAILRVRGQNFMISTSYLALHSTFFYDLFYGPKSTGQIERFELDCDPHTFGDLLDIIYPCYKKTNCCGECTSSAEDRLNLAIELKMKFAIKRLLQGNLSSSSSDSVAVSAKFPDAVTVKVQGLAVLVSASALSLHSPVLSDLLYKDGQLVKEINIDMDRRSFCSFVRATTGNFPAELTSEFLDGLHTLQADNLYNFYLSERNKLMSGVKGEDAHNDAMKLLKHYSNQPNQNLNKMKSAVRNFNMNELENFLHRCTFLSRKLKKFLRKNAATTIAPFTMRIQTPLGKIIPINCERGASTTVEEAKILIQKLHGIPPDQQSLVFGGKRMEDERTLGDYEVQHKSIVHWVVRLRGC